MRVKWLRAALRELDAEIAYIAQGDPETARKRYGQARTHVAELGQFPEAGRPGRVPGTRELVLAGLPYIVPYRVRGQEVQVLRFFHTSRKPPMTWEDTQDYEAAEAAYQEHIKSGAQLIPLDEVAKEI